MKDGNRSHKLFSNSQPERKGQSPSQNWLGRLIGTLNFVVVIIFLGAWITGFIFLDQYLSTTLSGNMLNNLICISFFGGLILAFLIAAVASSLLRRFFWKSSVSHQANTKN